VRGIQSSFSDFTSGVRDVWDNPSEFVAALAYVAANNPRGIAGALMDPFIESKLNVIGAWDSAVSGDWYSVGRAYEDHLRRGTIAACIMVACKAVTATARVGRGLFRGSRVVEIQTPAQPLNFTKTTAQHMANPKRYVPEYILRDVIRYGKSLPDPQGTSAMIR